RLRYSNGAAPELAGNRSSRRKPSAANGFRKTRKGPMIGKTILTVLFSAALVPATGLAGESLSQRFQSEPAGGKFPAQETTLDAFGSLKVPEHKDMFDGRLGIGIGVNHFFTTYFGAG